MLELPAARHRPHLHKSRQITCRRRRRTLRDAHIISRTESALKAINTLAKNSQRNFFLARIDQVSEAVEKLRLLNKELHTLETESLRLEHHRAKIFQPITNLVGTTGLLKRLVITLTPLLKNSRNRDQSRLTHSLRQRHFSNRSPNPTIAILEWMYRLEIKVRRARAGKARHRFNRPIEPSNEFFHLPWNHTRRRCLKMHNRIMHRTRYDSHRLSVTTISSNHRQIQTAAHAHAVPLKQFLIRQRRGKTAVKIDLKLGYPTLGRLDPAPVMSQSKQTPNRRLKTLTVHHLPLNARSQHRLITENFSPQQLAILLTQMRKNTHMHARKPHEFTLHGQQPTFVITKIRPVRKLPVPWLERLSHCFIAQQLTNFDRLQCLLSLISAGQKSKFAQLGHAFPNSAFKIRP